MSQDNLPLTEELDKYLASIVLREPEVLRAQREEMQSHPHAGMQSAPAQGQFLSLLTQITGAKKTLEVGVFLGYSSTWVALALPPGGKVVACDLSEEYTSRARQTWRAAGVEDRIELHLGPALETLDRFIAEGQSGTFDLAFVDADKTNYANYYERALQLIRRGGVIAIDNVLWHGRPIDPSVTDADTEAIRAFNRKVYGDSRVAISLVPLGDGLTLACKL